MITHNNLVCYFFFYSLAISLSLSPPPPPPAASTFAPSPLLFSGLLLYLSEGDEISVGLLVRDAAVTNLHVGFLDVSLKLLGVSHV